jgi:hypothetical protein
VLEEVAADIRRAAARSAVPVAPMDIARIWSTS